MAKNIALTLGWTGILQSKFYWSFFWVLFSSIFVTYPIITALVTILPFWMLTLLIPLKLGTKLSSFSLVFYMFLLTMIFTIFVFAYIYFKEGLYSSGVLVDIGFLDALYFSVTTWTTLGYGDLLPVPSCRLVTSIEALLGYYSMGMFVVLASIYIKNVEELVDYWFFGEDKKK